MDAARSNRLVRHLGIGRRLAGYSHTLLPDGTGPRFDWVWTFYNGAHSALVFALIFGAIYRYLRGWFAIRFLWPLSAYRLDGIPWEKRWLLAANWAALAAIWTLLVALRSPLAANAS